MTYAENASKIFTKPGLVEKAHQLQKEMVANSPAGTHGFSAIRNLLIEQVEWEFEQLISQYPHVVEIPSDKFEPLRKGSDPSPLFDSLEEWLKQNVPADQYIAFPDSAMGNYKDCYFNVYFKDISWAVLFKMSCL